jgi:hypothetical protein
MESARSSLVKSARSSLPDRRALTGGIVIVWVALSPWLWGFANSRSAVANHVFLVFSFGPLTLIMANLRPAAFVTLLGGMWLVVSPWVLGYASDRTAWLNELVTGMLLIILAADAGGLRSLIRLRSKRAGRRTPAAGSMVGDPAGSHQ